MALFNLYEKIDLEKANYLLKLPQDYILSDIYDNNEIDSNGSRINSETYIKSLKGWLKKVIDKKGKVRQCYKYSKQIKDKGRQFINGFGVQSLQKDLRGFLVSGLYNDFDMINAQPTILSYINKTYFKDNEMPFLDKYINNRKDIMTKWKFSKDTIFINMNAAKSYTNNNEFLKGIDIEFKKIQKLIYESELDIFTNIDKTGCRRENKYGSFLNRVLCVFENEILCKGLKEFKSNEIGSLMFDGALIDSSLNIDECIDRLNIATDEYGVKWICKPHSDKLKIDTDYVLPTYEDEYTLCKNEFEETHAMIKEPLQYIIERYDNDKRSFYIYNRGDFQALTGHYTFTMVDDGKQLTIPLTMKWFNDPDRRMYIKQDFLPHDDYDHDTIYNLFSGFEINEKLEEADINADCVRRFIDHIKLLCGNDANAVEYLLNYLAHLFQKPYELPMTCVVFCGMKGVGKDLIIDYIEKIIGKDYITRTQSFNELFGNFNQSIKHKLLIQIDEVSGSDGYKMKEELKNIVTKNKVTINEKGLRQYDIRNYCRVFMNSNNHNPIEITEDNRRFFVVQAGEKQDKTYYDRLYNDMKRKECLQSIYSFLMDRDISDYRPLNLVETDKMRKMKEHNINPIFSFLKDFVFDNVNDDFKYELDRGYISSKTIYEQCYMYFDIEGHSTKNLNYKGLKSVIVNMRFEPIFDKYKKIDGKSTKVYYINKQLLKKSLLTIFNSDDFTE